MRDHPVDSAGRVVVAMMARAPAWPGKSRIAAGLSAVEHAALREALFDDTFDVVRQVRNVVHAVVYEPASAGEEVRARLPHGVLVVPQSEGELGERLLAACRRFCADGARGVVFVGSDLPDLPVGRIREAVAHLTLGPDRIVLGPATDGGYYLIAMRRCQPELFTGIAWGSERVLAQTLVRARRLALDVVQLDAWADVDTQADIARVVSRHTRAARRTRAWDRAVRASAARHARLEAPPEEPDRAAAPAGRPRQDA
jgi:rSAM/selenodomain-associated transferase 1